MLETLRLLGAVLAFVQGISDLMNLFKLRTLKSLTRTRYLLNTYMVEVYGFNMCVNVCAYMNCLVCVCMYQSFLT